MTQQEKINDMRGTICEIDIRLVKIPEIGTAAMMVIVHDQSYFVLGSHLCTGEESAGELARVAEKIINDSPFKVKSLRIARQRQEMMREIVDELSLPYKIASRLPAVDSFTRALASEFF